METVHEIVLLLPRTGEREFVASHEIKKHYIHFHKEDWDDWNSKILCLYAFVDDCKHDWDLWIDNVAYAYNTSRHELLGVHNSWFMSPA